MDINTTFCRTAADLVRLRRALYGPEDAQALMLRCYKRQGRRDAKVNERTLLQCWQEMDDAQNEALGFTKVAR